MRLGESHSALHTGNYREVNEKLGCSRKKALETAAPPKAKTPRGTEPVSVGGLASRARREAPSSSVAILYARRCAELKILGPLEAAERHDDAVVQKSRRPYSRVGDKLRWRTQRSPDHKGILRAGLRTVFRSVERKPVSGYRQFHETNSQATLAWMPLK